MVGPTFTVLCGYNPSLSATRVLFPIAGYTSYIKLTYQNQYKISFSCKIETSVKPISETTLIKGPVL